MQGIELAHGFLVELACGRRLVEIQVTAKHFVGAFAGQHHLHTHGLDAARQQKHRRGRANRGDVVGLDMTNHLGQRIQPFLEGVTESVMHRTQRLGGDLGRLEVGRTFKANRKGMQARPPGLAAVVVLDALAREACRHGRHQRGIEATR